MKTTMMVVVVMSGLVFGIGGQALAESESAQVPAAGAGNQAGIRQRISKADFKQIAPEKREKLFQKLEKICGAHPRLCAYFFKQRFGRQEDIRDAQYDGGRADRLEDIYDRRADQRDRREDRWDRLEDVRDRRENVRDHRENIQDRRAGSYGRGKRN